MRTDRRTDFCDILMKLEFLGRLSKNTQISNFMTIRTVGAEFFYSVGRANMTKLTVASRSFQHAPKNGTCSEMCSSKSSTCDELYVTLHPNIYKYYYYIMLV
jgi:hypothetical protein